MTNLPLVSVIIPVYNAEKYLEKAINSIVNQSYRNLEIIVINDGSVDHSHLIVTSFTDSRIKYIKQDNQGLSKTLNSAIRIASGKYICRMDADDISDLDRIKIQIEILEKNKNIILVGSNIMYIDENDKIKGYSYLPSKSDTIKNKLRIDNCIFHPSVIFRKSIFEQCGGYNESVNIFFEDYLLWLSMLPHGDFYICPKFLLKYREHDKSITNRTPPIVKNLMKKCSIHGKLTEQEIRLLHEKRNILNNKKNKLSTIQKVKKFIFRSKLLSILTIKIRNIIHI
ncbi:glycosyltransferase [Proteus mirabilis]|uniref:glycosyltransferase n=1 Tax=Proteus mirabilis TaxID=584 RepID=UPI002577965C|nr:glycosyltransferase [Proteus mirabilis]MDM3838405.1 glycosyltransferase [Proteus mirabilis]